MSKSMGGLVAKLKGGKFVTLGELEVDSQTSIEKLLERARSLQNVVDALIVNRHPKASLSINTLVPSYLIKERLKIESIYSVDSRDKNRLALFSDILTASQLGLTNILVSTGVHTTTGAYTKAQPVFDLDGIQLLTMIKKMSNGKAFSGEEIQKPMAFDIGALVGFDSARLEMTEALIKKKKDAGASYFLTVPIYESEKVKMIANLTTRIGMPLIVTLYPIESIETANWIGKLYPNTKPPEDFIGKIKAIEADSSKAEVKNKQITELNMNFINIIIKELKTLKGVSGCNVVSTKLDILKTRS